MLAQKYDNALSHFAIKDIAFLFIPYINFCYFKKKQYFCAKLYKMLKLLLLTLGILASAILLMSVRVLLKKNGRFSSEHISHSRVMRQRGIGCATSQHRQGRKARKTAVNVKEL